MSIQTVNPNNAVKSFEEMTEKQLMLKWRRPIWLILTGKKRATSNGLICYKVSTLMRVKKQH
jgi:hypothetical protein